MSEGIEEGQLFIIGAARCGTTSLHHWLSQHSQICGSMPKEPRFFDIEYHKGMAWYRSNYFPHYNEQKWILDARPQNMFVHYVAQRIKDSCPNPRFIFLVRNPVDRLYSIWRHFYNMRPGREDTFFGCVKREIAHYDELNRRGSRDIFTLEREYITQLDPMGGSYEPNYIVGSYYIDHIRRFQELFGKESLLVVSLDELAVISRFILEGILMWLDLEVEPIALNRKGTVTEKVLIPTGLRLELTDLFQRSVMDLSSHMNRDFAHLWGYR